MALTEQDLADVSRIVVEITRSGLNEVMGFYGPRLEFMERAVGYLLDEARPRVMNSGDQVRIQRFASLDSEFRKMLAEIAERESRLRHGPPQE